MALGKHGLGWLRGIPDHRDHRYTPAPATRATLPRRLDLRERSWPAVDDQEERHTSTGHAVAFAYAHARERHGLRPALHLSALFACWNARIMEGTSTLDHGVSTRDVLKCVNTIGLCTEEDWPSTWGPLTRPSSEAFLAAAEHRRTRYERLDHRLDDLKACLAEGVPFLFGFVVFASIQAAEVSGDVPLHGGDEVPLGGQTAVAVGYDDARQCFVFRNSWGARWGKSGYGTIPYAYLTDPDLADDFWRLDLAAAA